MRDNKDWFLFKPGPQKAALKWIIIITADHIQQNKSQISH